MRGKDLAVDDALEPAVHRVSPDTRLGDVVDLMVRKRVGAVPVVGERGEVLGIITSGDVLDQVLRDNPKGDGRPAEALTARDVMTRSVLCVSEGQPLIEAAQMMVNKRVEQLPVVREGLLVGIVTRSKVLRALHLGSTAEPGEGNQGREPGEDAT
ncbi:MAG TPA: CBS domain-containing protein [Longimicrobiales bacterium]|nr:CBS domain-containing protein [Longimicrobiales bacterium]